MEKPLVPFLLALTEMDLERRASDLPAECARAKPLRKCLHAIRHYEPFDVFQHALDGFVLGSAMDRKAGRSTAGLSDELDGLKYLTRGRFGVVYD